MAAVMKTDPAFIALPGYDVVDTGYAASDIEVGDPVVISAAPPNKMYTSTVTKATGTDFHGICVKTVKQGGLCEYASTGEMDGFVGLTPGNSLTIVAGGLDDTQATGFAGIRAVNTTRIRWNVV